jgi:hypothetical protein
MTRLQLMSSMTVLTLMPPFSVAASATPLTSIHVSNAALEVSHWAGTQLVNAAGARAGGSRFILRPNTLPPNPCSLSRCLR